MNARRERVGRGPAFAHPIGTAPARPWAAAIVALAIVAGCGGSTALPTSFGVNLTVRMDAALRAQVRSVAIHVSGAEQFEKVVDVTAFSGNEARIHYVPGVQAGVLVFAADALDAGQVIVAQGSSGQVTLVPNQAVTALLELAGVGGGVDAGVDAPADGPRDAGGADTLAPGKKGEPCGIGGACRVGLVCADGLCCDTACLGKCSACNLAGREGTCSPVAAGTAPSGGHGTCGPDDPSTCQRDGTCDGMGACRLHPVGTTCRASKCDMTTDGFTPEFKCDGQGVCDSNIALACAPYRCKDTTACWSACTDATQCVAGKSCINGSCGLKGPGAMCALGQECASGSCADGVCCDRACTAGCESCALPGKLGTCTAVPAGMDPKGICPAGSAENAVCSPGGCEGNGGTACRRAGVGTTCRVGSCVNGTAVNPASCQSSGTCPPIVVTSCGAYVCGATSCVTSCNSDPDCVTGYYCASNKTCQSRKTAGLGCVATNECQLGLTCLDSVCCMSSSCPACRNCGAGGACSLVVGSAAGVSDTTGNVCSVSQQCNASGACLAVNGQACGGSGANCVSGNCVDGVCCSVASCGTCRNCGASGTCSVLVTSADDTSGATCAADMTCDATSTCKARWSLVGRVTTGEQPYPFFTTGAGNFIYFANASNSGGTPFVKSFNVATNVFADESKVSNPMCACGFEGVLVGQPLNNRAYYVANAGEARYLITGAAAWTALPGGYPVPRGEAATAVLGKRLYFVGGRGSLLTVQAYDTTLDTWTTTGIADLPVGIDQGCAGAFGGVVYAFGGRNNAAMVAYTESINKWTAVAAAPPTCNLLNLPTWRSKLVMADPQVQAVRVFNPTTQIWETPLPLPALAAGQGWTTAVAGAAGDLYVLGWAGGSTSIYKWVFN